MLSSSFTDEIKLVAHPVGSGRGWHCSHKYTPERAGSCTSQMRMLPLVPGTGIAPNAVVNSATSFSEGYVGHEPFHERKGDHWVGDAASLGSGAAKAWALRTGLAGLPRSCCRQSRQAGG